MADIVKKIMLSTKDLKSEEQLLRIAEMLEISVDTFFSPLPAIGKSAVDGNISADLSDFVEIYTKLDTSQRIDLLTFARSLSNSGR